MQKNIPPILQALTGCDHPEPVFKIKHVRPALRRRRYTECLNSLNAYHFLQCLVEPGTQILFALRGMGQHHTVTGWSSLRVTLVFTCSGLTNRWDANPSSPLNPSFSEGSSGLLIPSSNIL